MAERCKCDFPTMREYARDLAELGGALSEDEYSKIHRAYHDEWDARRNLNPDTDMGKLIAAQSVAVEHELRLARLEAAVVALGVDLPVLGPVDAAVRSVAAGRLTATGDE